MARVRDLVAPGRIFHPPALVMCQLHEVLSYLPSSKDPQCASSDSKSYLQISRRRHKCSTCHKRLSCSSLPRRVTNSVAPRTASHPRSTPLLALEVFIYNQDRLSVDQQYEAGCCRNNWIRTTLLAATVFAFATTTLLRPLAQQVDPSQSP